MASSCWTDEVDDGVEDADDHYDLVEDNSDDDLIVEGEVGVDTGDEHCTKVEAEVGEDTGD